MSKRHDGSETGTQYRDPENSGAFTMPPKLTLVLKWVG